MKNSPLLLPALSGLLVLTGCVVDPVGPGPAAYQSGPEYYQNGPAVDVYYVEDRPYSRQYGPLIYRDDRYYYNRGGSFVIYDRPVRRDNDVRVVVRNDRDRDRHDTRVVVDNRDNNRDRDERDRSAARPPRPPGLPPPSGAPSGFDPRERAYSNNDVRSAEERPRATNPATIRRVEEDRRQSPSNPPPSPTNAQRKGQVANRKEAAVDKAKQKKKTAAEIKAEEEAEKNKR